eukprot:scaffold5992_cov78-Skeletonema_marinoi.AAC.4
MGERRQSTTSVEYLHDEFDFDKNKYVNCGSKEKRRNWYEKITKLEDVREEYLNKKGVGFEDLGKLIELLKEAKLALDSWFGFIPD